MIRAFNRTPPLVALMLLAMLAALAACTNGGGSTPGGTPTGQSTVTPTAGTATATPAAFATPTPRPPEPDDLERGGVLRIAFSERPPHNDPHLSSAPSVLSWGPGMVYSRLFRLQTGPEVPAPSRMIECELCETWRFVNSTTLEIQLRAEATWQEIAPLNGRLVTADDVVFSLERIAVPGNANSGLLANIVSVTAADERTVIITLETPDAEALEKLANAAARIVAPEAVEQDGNLRRGPNVGSGPWMLEEISPTAMTIVTNPDYWEGGLPYLDGLTIQYIAEPSTRLSAVRTGFLDADHSTPELARPALDRFPEFGSLSLRHPDQGVEVALNTRREPLDSLAVRQAIFYAWDPAAVISGTWSGEAFLSLGLSPPHPSWLDSEPTQLEGVFADPAAAQELFAETNIAETSLVIRVGDFSDRYREHAEAFATSLAELGIPTEVDVVTTRYFGDHVWLEGDYDIMVGAPPPVSGLTSRLLTIHHSDGPWNTTGYGSDELDRLIERQAAEYDPIERAQMYGEIAEAIIDGRHRFNAAAAATIWVWRPNVRNFHPNTQLGDTSFLVHAWLDR